jgi:hypothetical protein
MDHKQFGDLIGKGHITLHDMTEKTDGSAHLFGHDEHGFYTQYTGSGNEKMRSPQDFIERAKRRSQETGKPLDLGAAKTFGHIHSVLQSNQALQDHLRNQYGKTGKEVKVKGEIFYKPNAKPSDVPGEVKFVGTSYDPKHMGSVGKYIIHTKLPENEGHDVEHFKKHLSNTEINFDDDKIEGAKPSKIDVSEHRAAFNKLDHTLLGSRTTKSNKQAKEAEEAKLSSIQKEVSQKVDNHISEMNLSPRWGSGSEGIVVHPTGNQPRFKVTSSAFREYRTSDAAKNFKKRLVKEAIQIIMEGGNIKIGNVSASPFQIRNRTEQARDIHDALGQIHDHFHRETGEHLFGKGKKALMSGSTFAGSTRQLMDKSISDKEFTKHKPTVGDIDVQVTHEHKNALGNFLSPGKRFGKYTVVGTKKHGNENTAVMRHDNGEHHQFDFEGVEYRDHEPTKGEQFLHNSSWEDSKAGVKGAHHKILLNAVGLDTNKFSITHGLRSRTDESDPGEKEPEGVAKRLFGDKADSSRITSFHGVADLIKKHIPSDQHQRIYDKFKDSVSKAKMTGSDNALAVLRNKLNVKDNLNEESKETHHVHMSYLGASPITHMGHHIDVVGSMGEGPKFVGLSGKSKAFSDEEREYIANKQSGGSAEFKVENSPGFAIARAYNAVSNKPGRKVLHLHFGHDRKAFAEGLKRSVEAGKIPELQGNKFDSVEIHYPKDENRSHGMSGTKMRKAANKGNFSEFSKHLGNFPISQTKKIMDKVREGIKSGSIPLLRENNEYKKPLVPFMKYIEEETEKKPKTPEQEFYGYESNPKKKGPSQLGNVGDDVLRDLATKYFGPKVVKKKKLNEMECPPGIKKIRYKGTLRRKDMMVCPRRSGSSSGGNGD